MRGIPLVTAFVVALGISLSGFRLAQSWPVPEQLRLPQAAVWLIVGYAALLFLLAIPINLKSFLKPQAYGVRHRVGLLLLSRCCLCLLILQPAFGLLPISWNTAIPLMWAFALCWELDYALGIDYRVRSLARDKAALASFEASRSDYDGPILIPGHIRRCKSVATVLLELLLVAPGLLWGAALVYKVWPLLPFSHTLD